MSKLIKTILITGGSNGIGEGIIKLSASKGHNIIFTYNKRSEKAKKIVIKNKIKKDQILPIKIDLEKHSQIDTLFSKIIKKFGRIDCLINNAAYFVTRKKFENISLDHAKKIMNINFFANFKLSQKFNQMNKKSKEWKTIINISSTAAKFGGINFTHYAPTKAALENLTYGLSRELSENKIRVVNVAPGIIDTRNLKLKSSKADFQKIIANIPNKRLGSPKDVANLIEFLIDEKSNYINGTTITISGGR